MCSGKTHTLINLTSIAIVTPLLSYYSAWEPGVIATAALSAFFGTIFLSPDLDLKQSRSNQAWGWFRWMWYAYHRCFAHRRFSHLVVLGTCTRLLYLVFVALVAMSVFYLLRFCLDKLSLESVLRAQAKVGERIRELTYFIGEHPRGAAAMLGGLVFSDCLHLISDLVYSASKRLRSTIFR